MNEPLYKDKKFKTWNIERLAEVMCEEWASLHPELAIGFKTAYGYKATRISFSGEVHVTIDVSNTKFPDPDYISPLFNLSFSPDPDSLDLHVLNTFQLSDFMQLFSALSDKETLFVIGKSESWENSHFAKATQLGLPMINVLSHFDACFDFLTSDTYKIAGEVLNTNKLQMGQYLNRVKAYRMAETYGHPERLDEAVDSIRKSASSNDMAKRDLERLCTTKSPGSATWLYTPEMIERLCK